MKKLFRRIKFFFWWHFKACEHDKAIYDTLVYGSGFIKNGKRINPKTICLSNQRLKNSVHMTIQTLLQKQINRLNKILWDNLELSTKPERGVRVKVGKEIEDWHKASIKQILQAEVERLKMKKEIPDENWGSCILFISESNK